MTLTFVIPLYNEEARFKKTLQALKQGFSYPSLKLEKVIFVNDGSTDKTIQKLKRSQKQIEKALKARVQIISYNQNKGKGYAVKQGMLASQSDYTLLFDADISTPLSEFKKFVPFMKKGVNVIIGTRKNGKPLVIKYQPMYRQLLGRGFTKLSNIILGTKVTDFTCGFKCFSKDAKDTIFQKAKINRWGYDSEIIYLATIYNYSAQEVPVVWANDDQSKVSILKDIVNSMKELLDIRINHVFGFYKPHYQPTI